MREDNGAAVATHRDGTVARELALRVEQRAAHLRDAAHRRQQRRVGGIAQRGTGFDAVDARGAVGVVVGRVGVDDDLGPARAVDQRVAVIRVDPSPRCGDHDAPVEEPGVDQREPERRGETPAESRLATARRDRRW